MSRKSDTSVYDMFATSPTRNRQTLIERMYIRLLTELACNRFTWTGMPDTIDTRFLELTLFRNALSIFYFDNEFGRYMALRGSGRGVINMYDNPTEFMVLGNSMVNKTLDAKNCVPIWANYLRVPDWDIVTVYANKLAKIDRAIEMNVDASKFTWMVFADENQRQSYVNLMRQHTEGQPIIFGTPALNAEAIQAFPVGPDKEMVLNLLMAKGKLWNETMTLLGINNSNQDKKERLVADEVGANDGQVIAFRNIALNARTSAVETINRLYDLDVSVSWGLSPEAVPQMPGELV